MFEATAKFLPNNYYYSEPTFIADLKWEFYGMQRKGYILLLILKRFTFFLGPPTINNTYEAVKVGK